MDEKKDILAEVIEQAIDSLASNFYSENEVDRNFEMANVVDGLFAIARSLNYIGHQMEIRNEIMREQNNG